MLLVPVLNAFILDTQTPTTSLTQTIIVQHIYITEHTRADYTLFRDAWLFFTASPWLVLLLWLSLRWWSSYSSYKCSIRWTTLSFQCNSYLVLICNVNVTLLKIGAAVTKKTYDGNIRKIDPFFRCLLLLIFVVRCSKTTNITTINITINIAQQQHQIPLSPPTELS